MTAAHAVTHAAQQPADGTATHATKTQDDQGPKKKQQVPRKRKRKDLSAPIIPINKDVADKLQADHERERQTNAVLSALQEPLPLMLPGPFAIKASAPAPHKKTEAITAPQYYNNDDMLYLLSRLTVGHMQMRDVSKEPPKKINSLGGFFQAYVFCFKEPAKPAVYKTYYKDDVLEQFKEDFITDLRQQQPATAMMNACDDPVIFGKILPEGDSAEEETDRKQIVAQQTAAVLNTVLAKHKENDPRFERLPTGVYIDGSELQDILQKAAAGGVIAAKDMNDSISVDDTFKTGKRTHGITQARLYVDAITDEMAAYAYDLFAPYCTEEYQQKAWITVAPVVQ